MKKNYVLATVLVILVIVANMFVQKKFAPKVEPIPETSVQSDAVQSTSPVNSVEKPVEVLSATDEETNLTEQTFVVETDLIRAVFTNKGGDIISYKLKQHNVSGSTENVEMIENLTDNNRALSLALGDFNASAVNQIFNVKENIDAEGNKFISFFTNIHIKDAMGSDAVFTLGKHYKFLPDDYMFELVITVDGVENFSGLHFGNIAYTLRTAPQIGPTWNKNDRYDFRQFSAYINGKHKKTRVKAGDVKSFEGLSKWSAVSGKYFTFVVVPDSTPIQDIKFSAYTTNKSDKQVIENSQIFISRNATQSISQDVYRIYIGPSSEKFLGKYSNPTKNTFGYSNLRIDEISSGSSFGFLYPVVVVLKFLLQWTYSIVKNWGIAIILVTILIKIILFPLSWKTMLGTQRIAPFQPRIQAVQKKYKSDPQKMQAELDKIYKEAGYKPGCAGGCLPQILQFAVIIAMFQLFNNYFEFRGASFIPGWISDLSVGDSVLKFSNPLPFLKWTDLRLLPIIYVATQYTSTLLNKQPMTEQTRSMMFVMMYVMPGIFFFLLYNAPAGLFVYWIVSNVLMVVQQFIINSIIKKEKAVTKV
ncbi:MAG: membrane protein insertase YidC [Treponema sp.]|nr:MAG: membrane protein insertase YidC [Treponema sp.]